MKITVQTNTLQKILPFVNKAVSTKTQLPILSNILLETKGNTLIIKSTDLEIGIEMKIPAETIEEGSVAIPAKTFSEFVTLLSDDKITIESKEAVASVVTKKTKSSFQTMDANDFPKLYEEKGEVLISMPANELKESLVPVVFSASIDPTRPALSGLLVKSEMQPDGGGLLLVATDGYRLSLKHYVFKKEKEKKELLLIVPARVFREILTFKDGGEDISLYVSSKNNQIIFAQGTTTLVGRLISDEYPNYERIIPADSSTASSFDRAELLNAVKICSVFARETANIVKLSLKKDAIIVSSKTPSLGDNTVEVEAKLTGEENEIAFNARYLLDALANINSEEMIFEMQGPLNPGVFKIKNDSSYLHIIMPIRIQQ